MNEQTRVNNIQLKTRKTETFQQSAELVELPVRKTEWGIRFLQLDSLVRNLAVVGSLVLVMVAIRNSTLPETQSVFSAIQESTGMKWDESVGKLSFVNQLLPEEIQEVWNEAKSLTISVPLDGSVVHAWSQREPYVLISGSERAVHASADGEVISIAHGPNEERIIRIWHEDYESIYGNMEECLVEVGDRIVCGELIGTLLADQPLAFEVRCDGRSVDPSLHMDSNKE